MMTTTDRVRVVLTVRAEPAGPDRWGRSPGARLALLLRTLGALYGFRCERVDPGADPHAEAPTEAPGGAEGAGTIETRTDAVG